MQTKPASKTKAPVDHTEARELYTRYLARVAELEPHRRYAREIIAATAGNGMTPVKPFACMGTNGGPLLCDHCGKPIPLEGGHYNNVPAHVAWARNPNREAEKWVSWIKGGVVVELACNDTLRIYHGHPGNPRECADKAKAIIDAEDAKFVADKSSARLGRLMAFLREEMPAATDAERARVITGIVNTVLSYDPGLGCNRPG